MKYNRLLPLLIPFIVFVLFELFFFNPKMIYVSLVLSNLSVFFAIRQFALLNRRQEAQNGLAESMGHLKDWRNFLILPLLFLVSSAACSTLLPSKIIVQILFVFNSVFLYFYLRAVYYYLNLPAMHKNSTLENISSYGNFLTFFFASSVIYGLQSFLNISTWPLVVIVAAISALIVYQAIWVNAVSLKISPVYILISALILVELAWAVSFLPLNFNVAGLILAICYYMLMGLVSRHLLEKLDKRTVKLYLSFGFGSILLILLTARWM